MRPRDSAYSATRADTLARCRDRFGAELNNRQSRQRRSHVATTCQDKLLGAQKPQLVRGDTIRFRN